MITIGNFFFKYRNWLFIILYLLLFLPSPELFTKARFGENYYWIPIILGLVVTFSGQLIRGMTIGLDYIIRGGRDKKVYAENLVTGGLFSHVRNPLYVGNILMLLGVGIMANSLWYVLIVMPLFLFIYQCIVLAEENFLRGKFGPGFDDYTRKVNRWFPNPVGLAATLSSMHFKWRRWLIKEYNTQFVWLSGIACILALKYPQLFGYNDSKRWTFVIICVLLFGIYYFSIRYLKKKAIWTEA